MSLTNTATSRQNQLDVLEQIAANTASGGGGASGGTTTIKQDPTDLSSTVTGVAQSALNTDLLTGSTTLTSNWTDVRNFSQIRMMLIGSAGISAGQVVFEFTNDPNQLAGAGVAVYVEDIGSSTIATVVTLAASSVRMFNVQVQGLYFRARISVAFTGGTAQAVADFYRYGAPQNVRVPNSLVNQAGFVKATDGTNTAAVKAASTAAAATDPALVVAINPNNGVNAALPGLAADVASAALTTTTTTATIAPTVGSEYEVNIPVTAVTGTSPTLDVVVQESDDAGTNWFDVYHFERITATGIYRSPKLLLTGNRIRYVQTVSGTTPSFTRAINRLQGNSGICNSVRRLFDRTVNVNSLNSVTPTLVTRNSSNAQLVLTLGAVTTSVPSIKLQGSENGVEWYDLTAPLAGVASSAVQITTANVNASFLRGIISTAGSGATLTYAALKAF